MNALNGQKRLTRRVSGRMVAGVCAGLGDYLGVDANIVRLLMAALTVFTGGAFGLVYLAAWAVVPEEGEAKSVAERYLGR
jgi:phage shock protein C